jgi:hypothetical protein
LKIDLKKEKLIYKNLLMKIPFFINSIMILDMGWSPPSYSVHLQTLLPAWRNKLIDQGQLLEEAFDITQLKVEQDAVYYKDITAKK